MSEGMVAHWYREQTANRLVVNKKDGSVLIYVPAGPFQMGDGADSDNPKHEVYLDGYYIGMYCVTNGQYAKFVKETRHREPEGGFPSGKTDHPVVNVSWDDASAYGKWSGLELPTEAQWEKAARGPAELIYPWGNAWDEKKCRHDNNRGGEQTSEVWGYASGVSGYGSYGMSGNVWEWCRDCYESGYYGTSPGSNPVGPAGGSDRVCRGGSWGNDDPSNVRGACRAGLDPANRDDWGGVRLVRTVLAPGSVRA